MDTITIRSDIRESLEREAQRLARNVNDLANEVLERYVLQQDEEKLDREIEALKVMYDSVKAKYLGEYVAVHNGVVVDHDENYALLGQRIRRQYNETAVLIEKVTEQYVEELWFRTPSTGKIAR